MSIVRTELQKDDKGNIINEQSSYTPNDKETDNLNMVIRDYDKGYIIMHKNYREFNDMSLTERMSRDQSIFNNYQEAPSDDPDQAWMSRAIRPIARNKVISIAANVTAALIFPKVFAQNDNDEEDKEAAIVMRDLIEFAAEQADYEKNFLYGVISSLVNPGVIIHTEYAEVFREIRNRMEDGSIKKEEIVDELFSGFQQCVVPLDEVYIENIYEHNIQKQGFLVWRKVISYDTALAKYGDNENFKNHVRPGVQVLRNNEDGTFYEQWDTELSNDQVEEIIYWRRGRDMKSIIVNGVLITEAFEPNPRQDKNYPFSKSGYELFDEGKFFYFKSLINKLGPDEEIVNILYRMVIDGTFLQIMPPTASYGEEEIGSSAIAPGKNTSFTNSDSKMEPIGLNNNLAAGYNALNKVESSIDESSQDPRGAGLAEGGDKTKFEVGVLEQNARIQLGLFGKMIGFLVTSLGDLMISDILQFLTIHDVEQLTSPSSLMKFRNIIIPEKMIEGRKKTRKIEFTEDFATEGEEGMEEENELEDSFKVLEEEGGMAGDKEIFKVNPVAFREMKFKTKISADLVTPPSDNVKRALNLQEYDRAIANPVADQEALYRDLLLGSYDKTMDDTDKYINKKANLQSLVAGKASAEALPEQVKEMEAVAR